MSRILPVGLSLSDISLTLKTKKGISYDTIIDKTIVEQTRSYRYVSVNEYELDSSFTFSSEHDFRVSIADRKTLLSNYLSHKYPESQQAYVDFMKIHNIV